MIIFMLDIGSHLSFDLWMTLKRRNSIFNVISVGPTQISRKWDNTLYCRDAMSTVTNSSWPTAAILNFGRHIGFWSPYQKLILIGPIGLLVNI